MKTEIYDVAVVGAGPGGITAAAWCSELGMRTVMIERGSGSGGQLHSIFNPINNYPGISTSDGSELALMIERSFSRHDFESLYNTTVTDITAGDVVGLRIENMAEIFAKYLIFAAGISRKTLNIPGETEYIGNGVLRSGVGQKDLVKGKRLVIVGGGDAALENAMILSESADSVTIVHRRDRFTAQSRFIEGVGKASNVEVMMNSVCGHRRRSDSSERGRR